MVIKERLAVSGGEGGGAGGGGDRRQGGQGSSCGVGGRVRAGGIVGQCFPRVAAVLHKAMKADRPKRQKIKRKSVRVRLAAPRQVKNVSSIRLLQVEIVSVQEI